MSPGDIGPAPDSLPGVTTAAAIRTTASARRSNSTQSKPRPHPGAGVPRQPISATRSTGPSFLPSRVKTRSGGAGRYGSYVDEVALVAQFGTVVAGQLPLISQRYYLLSNHLYSPAAAVSDAGGVVERYKYDSYGKRSVYAPNLTALGGTGIGQLVTFTGRYLDSETGLVYFRARYYSVEIGTYIGRNAYRQHPGPGYTELVPGSGRITYVNNGGNGGGPSIYHDGYSLYIPSVGMYQTTDPTGEPVVLPPIVIGGGIALSALEAAAAAMGITVAVCLVTPACLAAAQQGIQDAINAITDAVALAAMRTACQALNLQYHVDQHFCRSCNVGCAPPWLRLIRCLQSTEAALCWTRVIVNRQAYIMMGCEVLLPGNANHAAALQQARNALGRCAHSIANNC